jgi:eukaryotic translation initiation factor 2C
MPPRGAGGGGRGGGPRGGGPAAGGPAIRGGPAGRGAPRGAGPAIRGGAGGGRGGAGGGRGGAQSVASGITIARDIQTIGVPRPGLGKSGRAVKVFTNHFATTIPESIICHYDGAYLRLSLFSSRTVLLTKGIDRVRCSSGVVGAYSLLRSFTCLLTTLIVIGGAENKNPARLNNEIMQSLQNHTAPGIFTPKVVYDGRKNAFAPRKLPFANNAEYQEVCIEK